MVIVGDIKLALDGLVDLALSFFELVGAEGLWGGIVYVFLWMYLTWAGMRVDREISLVNECSWFLQRVSECETQ